MATEPIYRTYCGVYPLSPDFKAFSLSISLSEVGTKDKEKGIRLNVLLDVSYIFYLDITLISLLRSRHGVPSEILNPQRNTGLHLIWKLLNNFAKS